MTDDGLTCSDPAPGSFSGLRAMGTLQGEAPGGDTVDRLLRRFAGVLWHRLLGRCGSGFWGGQRPSLAHYVTGMGPMDGATAAGGRSCCNPPDAVHNHFLLSTDFYGGQTLIGQALADPLS